MRPGDARSQSRFEQGLVGVYFEFDIIWERRYFDHLLFVRASLSSSPRSTYIVALVPLPSHWLPCGYRGIVIATGRNQNGYDDSNENDSHKHRNYRSSRFCLPWRLGRIPPRGTATTIECLKFSINPSVGEVCSLRGGLTTYYKTRDRNRQRGGYHLLATVFLARNHPQRCPRFCARS